MIFFCIFLSISFFIIWIYSKIVEKENAILKKQISKLEKDLNDLNDSCMDMIDHNNELKSEINRMDKIIKFYEEKNYN